MSPGKQITQKYILQLIMHGKLIFTLHVERCTRTDNEKGQLK